MATGLGRVFAALEADGELRKRLIRDPKGTVLYALPRQMGSDYDGVSVDDELKLVALAEFVSDDDALLAEIRHASAVRRDRTRRSKADS